MWTICEQAGRMDAFSTLLGGIRSGRRQSPSCCTRVPLEDVQAVLGRAREAANDRALRTAAKAGDAEYRGAEFDLRP